MNVKLLADLLAARATRSITAASGARGAREGRRRAARPGAARRDDAGDERLRGVPAIRAEPGDRDAAGGDGDRARSRPGARQGHRGGRRRLPDQADQPARAAGARALAAARSRRCTAASSAASSNRTLEQRVREQVGQLERLGRLKRFFSPAARRADRGRRRRGPAQEPPARDHGGVPRPARLHRLRGDRRARGGDGRAARVPRRDGPARSWRTRARSSASPATA